MFAAYFALLAILAIGAIFPLSRRWSAEKQDRRVALSVEWFEVRDLNARRGDTTAQILRDIRAAGASSIVLSPATLDELLLTHRVQPLGPLQGSSPLDVRRLHTSDIELARQIVRELVWRGVEGLHLSVENGGAILSWARGHFSALHDIAVGFDPQILKETEAAGLTSVLRIYEEPWLSPANLHSWMEALPRGSNGILFSSDNLPGGVEAKPLWRTWFQQRHAIIVLPEFHPTAASRILARALPANTFRVHSIPAAEMRDMTPEKTDARWKRALVERSIRMLLVRVGPNESRESLFDEMRRLSHMVQRADLEVSFPQPRVPARWPSRFQLLVSPWIALALICLTPAFALGWLRSQGVASYKLFFGVVLLSMAGALIAAAVADNPYTRLAITPFRGVKLGFLVSWTLVVLVMYEGSELRQFLSRTLTRQDVLIGTFAAAVLGYLLLRSGNASAGWKPGWEQSARDSLEALLVARPRFKEWALGYPLLWAGCSLQALYHQRRFSLDARLLICLGMIGPISMMNTFCHLHSPLWMELLRSVNGCVLGVIGGALLVAFLKATERALAFSRSRYDRT